MVVYLCEVIAKKVDEMNRNNSNNKSFYFVGEESLILSISSPDSKFWFILVSIIYGLVLYFFSALRDWIA